ncbi:TRAP transporter small permease subunit [Roseicitreum antarcticum]|uniref:TRAP transporter small permease protein n=1 Tax=Roseicitreum antarcticum TaxID=564137 RepID=A0A1H2VT45_9RHOB|nr:TRAP transporter small permease subunit [Roseicitreum antarcticum]SDW71446.1 Tripartite ATP-independent transporter, DctQ component [Roseicitreum antarcticum]
MTDPAAPARDMTALALRLFAWGTVTIATAFMFENWLIHWQNLPAARSIFHGGGGLAAAAGYVVAAVVAVMLALRGQAGSLRNDSARISGLVTYLARSAFFIVLLLGVVDVTISFLRIEGLLPLFVSPDLETQLGQAQWRGPYVHMPLAALGLLLGLVTRGLGFIWLALLVVVVQLVIVLGRFIFSYEQAFVSDLVRMWYAGLFLFASAFTLIEEGHVRVDVLFAGMSRRAKAVVNGIGSVVLGMVMMWTILILGTPTSASPIIGPVLRYEQGQQTYGMMTKYWMAVFLAIFAMTMLFQFAAYVLKAAADWRDEPDTTPQTAFVAG